MFIFLNPLSSSEVVASRNCFFCPSSDLADLLSINWPKSPAFYPACVHQWLVLESNSLSPGHMRLILQVTHTWSPPPAVCSLFCTPLAHLHLTRTLFLYLTVRLCTFLHAAFLGCVLSPLEAGDGSFSLFLVCPVRSSCSTWVQICLWQVSVCRTSPVNQQQSQVISNTGVIMTNNNNKNKSREILRDYCVSNTGHTVHCKQQFACIVSFNCHNETC